MSTIVESKKPTPPAPGSWRVKIDPEPSEFEVGYRRLTKRQRQCLELRCSGLSSREAADHLYIAPHSVRQHLCLAFKKLGANSGGHKAPMLCYELGRLHEREGRA